jgi:ATP-binding cassette subfamily F protein uup
MSAPNVLLLDEPTNDLDVQTLTILEDYLDDFPGAVIVVSHDRYFLDRIVEKVFAFDGNGGITQYSGNYSDYRDKINSIEPEIGDKGKNSIDKKPVVQDRPKERPRKLSFKEQREYEQIEAVIAGVEHELSQVVAAINQAGSNFELLQQLTGRQLELEGQLNELLDRWTYLNELVEEFSN